MSKINVLAVLVTDGKSVPVTTKSGLKTLLSASAEAVKIVPLNPFPGLVAATAAYNLPLGSTFVAHSPTGRKWTAEIRRNDSHILSVK